LIFLPKRVFYVFPASVFSENTVNLWRIFLLLQKKDKKMAYSNGRIYVDTSVTPNIGVSIRDVQRALGVGSPDLGTLCTHANINKWARYKPERYTGLEPMAFADRKENNFGLDVPFCYNNIMNGIVDEIINGGVPSWVYLKPRGDRRAYGQGMEFYRLTDFVRNPNERTPDSNGDPTPVNLQGYNHAARMPFNVFLNMAGITELWDSDLGVSYLQINKQVTQYLVFSFINAIGDDLHLQDFIDFNDNYGNIAWRPVAQMFDDVGTTDWYEQSQPQMEVSGDPISSNQGSSLEFRVSINNLSLWSRHHFCIGVGCCDQSSPLIWKSGNNKCFILPYTDDQASNQEWPFYYYVEIVSNPARRLNVTALQYFRQGLNQWVSAGGTVPYFNIDSLAAEQIRLTMTITKNGNNVAFVGENGTAPYGYGALRIQARESYADSSGETIKYMTPNYGTNPPTGENPWATAPYLLIPAGDESDTVTIFATMYINGKIPVNGYAQYHIYVNSGATDEHGQLVWDNIGYFSIQKLPYSNS
jgi:hypothetical protein